MKKLITVIFLIHFANCLFGQSEIKCKGLPGIKIKVSIVINGLGKNRISKTEDLPNDIFICLSDSSFKILGFIAVYDCHSGSIIFDLNSKTYNGNLIKANDTFIQRTWVGDTFVIDCINVEKNGEKFIIPGISLPIIN